MNVSKKNEWASLIEADPSFPGITMMLGRDKSMDENNWQPEKFLKLAK